nr:hypothetical protein [Hephaestia sp. MAHUQ-44]
MLRFGPDTGPIVILVPPLFEEANRSRSFGVTMLRALAERGIASVLPDLPGQGESEISLEQIRFSDWNNAISSLITALGPTRVHIAAIRSGGLLTRATPAQSRWLFAPQDGAALVRDLLRTRRLADEARDDIVLDASDGLIEIAGNIVSHALLGDLQETMPDRTDRARVVRLDSDPRDANRKVAGAPLWRRSEPGNDCTLAEMLAGDIADWIGTCGS